MAQDKTYFEQHYQAPFKGIHNELPANIIGQEYSPLINNFILKSGEIRTRPRFDFGIRGPVDNYPIDIISTFQDSNTVFHTVVVTRTGLWQLNPNWRANIQKNNKTNPWNLIGAFPVQPGPDIPSAAVTFLNKFYWTNGDNNIWVWDGIQSIGSPSSWPKSQLVQLGFRIIDSNGNVQVVQQAGTTGTIAPVWSATIGVTTADNSTVWVNNGKPVAANGFISTAVIDATNGITAGGFFIGSLASRMLLLSTIEGKLSSTQTFLQRLRWSPSGITSIWDPTVNIGAGYVDFLEVPDFITGFMSIGNKTGFVFRQNGITEMTAVSSGTAPFDFNHLWASERGIGNIFPFTIANYGPIGMFISAEDVYNLSLAGFKRVGGVARNGIIKDLANATSTPVATLFPRFSNGYAYLVYYLAIPLGRDTKIWMYSLDDDSWVNWLNTNIIITGRPTLVVTV